MQVGSPVLRPQRGLLRLLSAPERAEEKWNPAFFDDHATTIKPDQADPHVREADHDRNACPPRTIHSRAEFWGRVWRFVTFAAVFLLLSLGLGTAGYMVFAHLAPVDAFLNAAMILSGMGPVDPMPDDAAKIFAGLYAILSGAAYPAVTALALYPFLHRMMNILHLSSAASEDDQP